MAPAIMCFGKKPQDPGHRRNEEIEKVLRNERKRQEKEVKLLLLGAGESGKSTVLKQMRVIHTGGFSRNERKQWRAVIFNNLINAFNTIFLVMEEHDEMFEDQANTEYMNKIKGDPEIGPEERMPAEYLVAFNTLWDDRGVQMAMLKGNEYALHDNLSYFFDDVDRLFAPNYLPSDQDILRTRLRTTGISE